jgi:hypothetical protein
MKTLPLLLALLATGASFSLAENMHLPDQAQLEIMTARFAPSEGGDASCSLATNEG